MTETLDDLPDDARALLAGFWMLPTAELRFAMIERVPSPRAAAGLEALVARGLASCEIEPGGARTYRLTEAGRALDRRPPGETAEARIAWMDRHGRFPFSVPRTGDAAPSP